MNTYSGIEGIPAMRLVQPRYAKLAILKSHGPAIMTPSRGDRKLMQNIDENFENIQAIDKLENLEICHNKIFDLLSYYSSIDNFEKIDFYFAKLSEIEAKYCELAIA